MFRVGESFSNFIFISIWSRQLTSLTVRNSVYAVSRKGVSGIWWPTRYPPEQNRAVCHSLPFSAMHRTVSGHRMVIYHKIFPDWSRSNFENFFNFSMSYRVDAEIRHGYGELVPVAPHASLGRNLTEIIIQFGLDNKHLAQKQPGKDHTLCTQFVSNCRTKSERNAFVLFQRYLPISALNSIIFLIDEWWTMTDKSVQRESGFTAVRVYERWCVREMWFFSLQKKQSGLLLQRDEQDLQVLSFIWKQPLWGECFVYRFDEL